MDIRACIAHTEFGTMSNQNNSSNTRKTNGEDDAKKPRLSTTTFTPRFVLEEFYSLKVWRASVAELMGTAALVFGMDSIGIASYQTETKTPKLVMSLCQALFMLLLLLATFPISGAHINPAVTVSAALMGLIPISRAIVYILAQCAGAVLGALALKAVVGSSIQHEFSLGGCTLSVTEPAAGLSSGHVTVGIETSPALWLEIICTSVLLFASISIAFDQHQVKAYGYVTVCILVAISVGLLGFISTSVTGKKGYSGVGMNPAKCLGPAIVRGGHLWDRHWVFWIGPAISSVAFYLYSIITQRRYQCTID